MARYSSGPTWDDIGMMIGSSIGNAIGAGIGQRQANREYRLADEAMEEYRNQLGQEQAEQALRQQMAKDYGVGYQQGMTWSDARDSIMKNLQTLNGHLDALKNGTGPYANLNDADKAAALNGLTAQQSTLRNALGRITENAGQKGLLDGIQQPQVQPAVNTTDWLGQNSPQQGLLAGIAQNVGKPRVIGNQEELYQALYGGNNGLSYSDSMRALSRNFINSARLNPEYLDGAMSYLREQGINPALISPIIEREQKKIDAAKMAKQEETLRTIGARMAQNDPRSVYVAALLPQLQPKDALKAIQDQYPGQSIGVQMVNQGDRQTMVYYDKNSGKIVGRESFGVGVSPNTVYTGNVSMRNNDVNMKGKMHIAAMRQQGAGGNGNSGSETAGAGNGRYTEKDYEFMLKRLKQLEDMTELTPAQTEEKDRLNLLLGLRTEPRLDSGNYGQMVSFLTGELENAINSGATIDQAKEALTAYIQHLDNNGAIPDDETKNEYLRLINEYGK